MDILNRLQIIKYHQDAIIKFGINSKEALGWKNEKNQHKIKSLRIRRKKGSYCSCLCI